MNKISIIVPCYNEEESLSQFYLETKKSVSSISGVTYEFLFIDDGSKDHTLDILRLICHKDQNCRYFSFSRNFGKEAAMYAGLKHANGDFCVIMDADLLSCSVVLLLDLASLPGVVWWAKPSATV